MSINIPAETADESTNPISVEEFERLHPAMLGAIREVIREELAAWEEQPVFDHPQDMLLGGSEDGTRDSRSPRRSVTAGSC